MRFPKPLSLASSKDDIDDNDVEDGECLGVSLGEPLAVEGEDSLVVEVAVRLRRFLFWGTAVEAIVMYVCRFRVSNMELKQTIKY